MYPPRDSCISMYGYAESFVFLLAGNIAALSQFVPKFQLFSLSSVSELAIQWCVGRPCAAIYASHWRSFNQVFRVPTMWLKPSSAPYRASDCLLERLWPVQRRQGNSHLSLAPEKRAEKKCWSSAWRVLDAFLDHSIGQVQYPSACFHPNSYPRRIS